MRLIIEQRDTVTPGYKRQLGYTIQLNDGEVHKVGKGSPLAQAIRLVERLLSLSGEYS